MTIPTVEERLQHDAKGWAVSDIQSQAERAYRKHGDAARMILIPPLSQLPARLEQVQPDEWTYIYSAPELLAWCVLARRAGRATV